MIEPIAFAQSIQRFHEESASEQIRDILTIGVLMFLCGLYILRVFKKRLALHQQNQRETTFYATDESIHRARDEAFRIVRLRGEIVSLYIYLLLLSPCVLFLVIKVVYEFFRTPFDALISAITDGLGVLTAMALGFSFAFYYLIREIRDTRAEIRAIKYLEND